jgi:hypothetical protein
MLKNASPWPDLQGTKDFLKLRTCEGDKVRRGQRHFEALGVSFAVVVTAEEVLCSDFRGETQND